jgi:hypothetical protein
MRALLYIIRYHYLPRRGTTPLATSCWHCCQAMNELAQVGQKVTQVKLISATARRA